jgi:hypothetical protein
VVKVPRHQPEICAYATYRGSSTSADERAVNAGHEWLRIRGGLCGLLGSWGGWRAADTGGVEEAFDAAEAHAVGSGKGGGGGTIAVGGDQLGDLTLIEALAQASRTLCARSRGAHEAGESRSITKPQVSGLPQVRVSGKYLHQ